MNNTADQLPRLHVIFCQFIIAIGVILPFGCTPSPSITRDDKLAKEFTSTLQSILQSATHITVEAFGEGMPVNAKRIERIQLASIAKAANVKEVTDLSQSSITSNLFVSLTVHSDDQATAEWTYYYPDMLVLNNNGKLVMLRTSAQFAGLIQEALFGKRHLASRRRPE